MEFNVHRTLLDNGVCVVTEEMPHVRSVAIGVWVRIGSGDETNSNNGIAHFVEHMLFKGTHKRSALDIAQSLESYGGNLNASTGKEVSVYTAQVLDENMDIAIDVLTDLIQNPKFDAKDIELEKSVVLSEIQHAKEDPEEFILDLFYQNIFPGHPLGFFIQGDLETLSQFQRDDLINFMNMGYTPQRTVFAAAGHVDHQNFVDQVVKSYRPPWKSAGDSQPIPVPQQKVGKFWEGVDSVQQAHICIGSQTFGLSDPRRYALILLDILLGGGMSSRLFQNIREKYGFAYSVYSFIDFLKVTGVIGTYMACAPNRVDKSIDLLKTEFRKIITKSVPKVELERIKSQVKGSMILGFESTGRRMRKIGETEVYQRPHLQLSDVIQRIDNVQVDHVLGLAQEFLEESKLNITCLTPRA